MRKRIVAAGIDDQDVERVAGGRQAIGDALDAQRLRRDVGALLDVGADRHQVVDRIVFHSVTGIIEHRHRLGPARLDLVRESLDIAGHAPEVAVGHLSDVESKLAQFIRHQPRIAARIAEPAELDVIGIADDERQPRRRGRHGLSRLGRRERRHDREHGQSRDQSRSQQRTCKAYSHRRNLSRPALASNEDPSSN